MRSSNITAIHTGPRAHCFLPSGDTVLHQQPWFDAVAGHSFDQKCRGATDLLTRGGGQDGTSHQGHCRLVRPPMRYNLLLHTSLKTTKLRMLHMCLFSMYKWLTSCAGVAAYTAHLCIRQTCKVQIAHLCNVPLQRCKGSCGRQCVW